MIISLIVAMDEQRGIGKRGELPWRLSADLKRFKQATMGHHLIMGRVTYQSIGRLLPGRTMVILTRDPDYHPTGCSVAHSIEGALALARSRGDSEVFIIGGGEIFAQVLDIAERIYITQVHTRADCDVFFPELDLAQWREVECFTQPADEQNEHAFTYRLLSRLAPRRLADGIDADATLN